MKVVRCSICLIYLRTLKSLKAHYMKKHPKIQIVNKMIKNESLRGNVNVKKKIKPSPRAEVVEKPKQVQHFIHENLHISHNGNIITIENESTQDKLVELTFSDNCEPELQNVECVGTAVDDDNSSQKVDNNNKRVKKFKKIQRVQIGITKIHISKSLSDESGEFYECHCMKKPPPPSKASSDTESAGSESGKTFYCTQCGNGHNTPSELKEHEKTHEVACRICNQIFDWTGFKEHFEQHLIRIYVCHACGLEFTLREALLAHLHYHQEQKVLDDVLDMERDYYRFNNFPNFSSSSSGDHAEAISNIVSYLSYPSNHIYSRSYFTKIACDICRVEIRSCEYENHLKAIHGFQM